MSRCINRKRFNHQKATRAKHSLRKRLLKEPVVLDQPRAVVEVLAGNRDAIVTAHQRQAKNSNPTAPIRLSAKKIKKIRKRARMVYDFVPTNPYLIPVLMTFLFLRTRRLIIWT